MRVQLTVITCDAVSCPASGGPALEGELVAELAGGGWYLGRRQQWCPDHRTPATRSAAARDRLDAQDTPGLRAAVAAGDRDAYAAMWRQHQPMIYGFLRKRGASHQTAEDLTAEAFTRGLAKLDGWQEMGHGFGAWLVTIARNLLADHWKSAGVSRTWPADFTDAAGEVIADRTPAPDHAAAVAERMVAAEWRQVLADAVAGLTGYQRQVIRLRFFDELSVADTAAKLGVDEGAVKAVTFRAVRSLGRNPAVRALWDDLAEVPR